MIFAELKVAQMAAYFLQLRGGRMAYLKLMKLLYLADREAMDRFCAPISDDAHYSMRHGPVLSETLNLMTGQRDSAEWSDWISPCANHEVAVNRNGLDREDFDELSDAEIRVLDDTWQKFGHMDRWQLVDYTHEALPEWVDPGSTSIPIDPRATFKALGRTEGQADEISRELRTRRQLARAMADYR